MQRMRLPLLAGLAHGVADGTAGWLLGSLPTTSMSLQHIGMLILLYNLLGFGCQPLVGYLTDHVGQHRLVAQAGLGLIAAAALVGLQQPTLAVALAGLGSAAFHVGGGALALGESEGRAGVLGVFAAPGVVGLAIGGLLAAGQVAGVVWVLLLLLLACGSLIQVAAATAPEQTHGALPTAAFPSNTQLDSHDLVMLLLLAAIALRSAVWETISFVSQHHASALLLLAVAAALGKLGGGFLADWLGWRRYALVALGLAAPLLALSDGRPWLLLPGVALLQSTTPLGLALVARHLPRLPATAAGLTFGLAIAAGGLPHALGFSSVQAVPLSLAALTLASALALWWGAGPMQKRQSLKDCSAVRQAHEPLGEGSIIKSLPGS